MKKLLKAGLASFVCMVFAPLVAAAPTVGTTTILGPFTGPGATLHSDNQSPYAIDYYGTDLGVTYEHDGEIKILFGDTWSDEDGTLVDPVHDDTFGVIDLGTWDDPSTFSSSNIPIILLGQSSTSGQMLILDPGHYMDPGKTPMDGWSNGTYEYALFNTTKPEGCKYDSDCDVNLVTHMSCDNDLGFWNEEYFDEIGWTWGCIDGQGWPCLDDTMANFWGWPIANTGFCVDEGSTVWSTGDGNRLTAMSVKHRIAVRSTSDPEDYTTEVVWQTNRFNNVNIATVEDFVPSNGSGSSNQDYNTATDSGDDQRIFLFGRPTFVGVDAYDRNLGLYFAYVDMPTGTSFSWNVNYYTGTSGGVPQFSTDEDDAAPLDLDSDTSGIQIEEDYDIVDQMSVVWIDHLDKWVMFYGGGMNDVPMAIFFGECGILELFTGPECDSVDLSNGAVRMRTADDPWGPWSPPQDVIAPGDWTADPPTGQYADNGVLYHPDCSGSNCAEHSDSVFFGEGNYGFFYAANIIEPWIEAVGDDVDVIWNLSTWDPYGVILLRTRIEAD